MFIDIRQLNKAFTSKKYLDLSPQEFANHYTKAFPNVVLGCTFRPESMGSVEDISDCLTELKKLGIGQVRLGLRWNRIEKKPGVIDLSFYKPIITKLLKQNAKICLNIGPTKSAGWPEQFIPDWVLNECDIKKKQCIHIGDDIAVRALDYTDRLLKILSEEFGEKAFASIQPENEGFKEFGLLKTTVGEDYLNETVRLIEIYFPATPVMLNSAGRTNIFQIYQFIKKNKRQSDYTVGYNYYFVTDSNYKLYPLVRYFDDFVRMSFTSPSLTTLPPGVATEISECQFEKWGRAQWPGNNYEAFCYALWRSGQAAPAGQDKFVVRLWGVEKLIKKIRSQKLTKEHEKIIELIKLLQTKID